MPIQIKRFQVKMKVCWSTCIFFTFRIWATTATSKAQTSFGVKAVQHAHRISGDFFLRCVMSLDWEESRLLTQLFLPDPQKKWGCVRLLQVIPLLTGTSQSKHPIHLCVSSIALIALMSSCNSKAAKRPRRWSFSSRRLSSVALSVLCLLVIASNPCRTVIMLPMRLW